MELSVICEQCGDTTALPKHGPPPLVIAGDYIEPQLIEVRCVSCGGRIKVPRELGIRAVQASFGFDENSDTA